MRFPEKEKRRVPKRTAQFPAKKDGILHPPSGSLGTPLPESVWAGGRAYADVTTKISRIHRLPNLVINGGLLARLRARAPL